MENYGWNERVAREHDAWLTQCDDCNECDDMERYYYEMASECEPSDFDMEMLSSGHCTCEGLDSDCDYCTWYEEAFRKAWFRENDGYFRS